MKMPRGFYFIGVSSHNCRQGFLLHRDSYDCSVGFLLPLTASGTRKRAHASQRTAETAAFLLGWLHSYSDAAHSG